jgi:hypothetical protein
MLLLRLRAVEVAVYLNGVASKHLAKVGLPPSFLVVRERGLEVVIVRVGPRVLTLIRHDAEDLGWLC